MRPWTNLLTKQDAYRDAVRQTVRRYGLPWAAVFAAVVALLALDLHRVHQARQRRDRWLKGAQEVQRLKERIAAVHAKRMALEAKIRAANAISRGLPPPWVLALALKAVEAADQVVALHEMQVVEEDEGGYTVRFHGEALDHRGMSRFVHALAAPGVRAVEILSIRAAPVAGASTEFDVQVELERAGHE